MRTDKIKGILVMEGDGKTTIREFLITAHHVSHHPLQTDKKT